MPMHFGLVVKTKRSSSKKKTPEQLAWILGNIAARKAAPKHATLSGALKNGDDVFFHHPDKEREYALLLAAQDQDKSDGTIVAVSASSDSEEVVVASLDSGEVESLGVFK